MKKKCQRCDEVGFDRRTLWMYCLYDMSELGLPFERAGDVDRTYFTLLVCKECRADWMAAIKAWFDTKPSRASTGTGAFIRELGANREMTAEEVEKLKSEGRTVHSIKPDDEKPK